MKPIAERVEYWLRNVPETRDSDTLLTMKVWANDFPSDLNLFVRAVERGMFEEAVLFLRELPSQDNIKRIRAQFNHDGKYYPTSWTVAKKRGIEEDRWRMALGYPAKEAARTTTKAESYMDPELPKTEKLL